MTDAEAPAMRLIYTTWPDAEAAERVAAVLLNDRLVACANMLAPMRSVFRWEGAVQRETEIPVLFKTSARRAVEVQQRISALHPYDEPCIIALPVDSRASSEGFLRWVSLQVSG
ncbi:MAG: divalent-cation tolerance protein CutA [Pseudomonadota bacterium]